MIILPADLRISRQSSYLRSLLLFSQEKYRTQDSPWHLPSASRSRTFQLFPTLQLARELEGYQSRVFCSLQCEPTQSLKSLLLPGKYSRSNRSEHSSTPAKALRGRLPWVANWRYRIPCFSRVAQTHWTRWLRRTLRQRLKWTRTGGP